MGTYGQPCGRLPATIEQPAGKSCDINEQTTPSGALPRKRGKSRAGEEKKIGAGMRGFGGDCVSLEGEI